MLENTLKVLAVIFGMFVGGLPSLILGMAVFEDKSLYRFMGFGAVLGTIIALIIAYVLAHES